MTASRRKAHRIVFNMTFSSFLNNLTSKYDTPIMTRVAYKLSLTVRSLQTIPHMRAPIKTPTIKTYFESNIRQESSFDFFFRFFI